MPRSSSFGIHTLPLILLAGLAYGSLGSAGAFASGRPSPLDKRLETPSGGSGVPVWTIPSVKRSPPSSSLRFMERTVQCYSSKRFTTLLSSSLSASRFIRRFTSSKHQVALTPTGLLRHATQPAIAPCHRTMTICLAHASASSSSFTGQENIDERGRADGMDGAPLHLDSVAGTESIGVTSIPSSSELDDDMGDDDSLEALQLRIQALVKRYQQPAATSSNVLSLIAAIAGGGGHFLSTLSATPGASKVLLQGNILYNREAFQTYVRQHSPTPDGTLSGSDCNLANGNAKDPYLVKFRYASMAAAQQASVAALQQASQLLAMSVTTSAERRRSKTTLSGVAALPDEGALSALAGATGIGCASVLRTTVKNAKGISNDNGESRAYVVVTRQDGQQLRLCVALGNEGRRNRFQEDVFVAHCIVTCLEQALIKQCSGQTGGSASLSDTSRNRPAQWTVTTGSGDVLEFSQAGRDNSSPPSDPPRDVVEEATNRILSQQSSVVALIPSRNENTNAPISFSLLTSAALPPSSLVFPGSFNPIHQGHAQLAQAGLQATASSISRDLVWFELALTNADKPPLSVADVQQRVQFFADYFAAHANAFDFAWGILLTNAPLFRQKVQLLQPLLIPRAAGTNGCASNALLDMIVGTDTLVRLLDPKYYHNSRQEMLQALQDMPCRFIVGGRVAPSSDSSTPVFVTGREQVESLPIDLQSKFVVIQEEDFRVDISSTELRRRRQQQQQQQQQLLQQQMQGEQILEQ